jgi:hypothetical protein
MDHDVDVSRVLFLGFIEKGKNDGGQAGFLLVDDDRKKALRAQQEEDYRTERERERDKYDMVTYSVHGLMHAWATEHLQWCSR